MFENPYDENGNPINEVIENILDMFSEPEKAVAAAAEADIAIDEIKEDGTRYHAGKDVVYKVLLEHEADDVFDKYLEHYIDNVLDIPDSILPYFDEKAWKNAATNDGRGLLASDGVECIQVVNGTIYYLYIQ